jgi:hypothetical protein
MHGRLADLQNMAVEQKRLAYNEAVWAVREIDLIEDNRKLQMRIGSSANYSALTSSNSRTGAGQLGQGHRRHGRKTKGVLYVYYPLTAG